MTLSTGTKLGRYEIRSLIGAGGMGEVYMARDPKIGRDVAIKVLPADFSADKERVGRFEQEAQAAGALNHPNILAIHDVDTQDGILYVVSELLEGEELRQRLDEGPIPLRKVTEYAQQIVSGLSAAHEKGIVHRDLKPENLFITNDDRVKILDFGLAKLRERESNIHGSEDATRKAMTDPGVVMGTVGYMSPEQVRGQSADHRSDIFSFGVILYEMLTGNKAFHGDSVVELMNAILKEDVPEFEDENRKISPSFDKLMQRCLEKKPEHRFYSAHDLGFALDALSSPTSSSGTNLTTTAKALGDESAVRSSWLDRIAWIAAGLFLLTTVILSALYFRRPEPHSQTMRFTISPPSKMNFGDASQISPDGTQVAFISIDETGGTSLWVRNLGSLELRQLAGTEGADFPFWSPDSRSLGFFAGAKLKKIDAGGGPAQTLADGSADPRGGTWGPDGTILFSPNTLAPLFKIPAPGGTASQVTTLDESAGQNSHRWPSFLPDGRHFLYFGRNANAESSGIYVGSLDSKDTKLLLQSKVRALYAPAAPTGRTGYLLYFVERTLMAQPFDPGKLELSGEAVPLIQGVLSFPTESGPTAYSSCSVSDNGILLYHTGKEEMTQLTWFDRNGKPGGAVAEPGFYHEPSLSSDGKKILVGKQVGGGMADLYLLDLVRSVLTRLTFDPAQEVSSIFSPDGSEVVFTSPRRGKLDLYKKTSNGAGNDELFLDAPSTVFADDWSRDGKYILYEGDGGPKFKSDLWVLPLAGDRQPLLYLQTQFSETHARFSPDGRWVAYSSDESGRSEIYVQSFPASGGKWQISTAGGDQVGWRGDGKELFYVAPDRKLMAVSVNAGTNFEPGKPVALFRTHVPITGINDDRNNYVLTPDGQRFLVNELVESENSQPLTLVLNWAAEIKK